jgi:hypothetical protein
VQRGRGRGDPLGEAAEHPRHALAELGPAARARRARPARDGVADEHQLAAVLAAPDGLVAEPRRVRPEDEMAVAQALHVGRAGRRRLDRHDDLALRLGDFLDAQHPAAVEHRGPHGRTTAFSASPRR